MRHIKLLLTIATLLTSASALSSPIYCPVGNPSGARTGFFYPNPNDLINGCPIQTFGCVQEESCPKPVPPQCPEGTHFMEITKGFNLIDEENGLSCPIREGACVSDALCPQLSPINCTSGNLETAITGFFPVGNGLACPIIEMACVNYERCPLF